MSHGLKTCIKRNFTSTSNLHSSTRSRYLSSEFWKSFRIHLYIYLSLCCSLCKAIIHIFCVLFTSLVRTFQSNRVLFRWKAGESVKRQRSRHSNNHKSTTNMKSGNVNIRLLFSFWCQKTERKRLSSNCEPVKSSGIHTDFPFETNNLWPENL